MAELIAQGEESQREATQEPQISMTAVMKATEG